MTKGIAQTNQTIDENLLLGSLFFYTLGDIKLTEQELENVFAKNNMDTRYIRKISPIDAFRRATSAAKQNVEIEYNGNRVKAKLEVDEISNTTDEIHRVLGRKLIDSTKGSVSYQTVGSIIYQKNAKGCWNTPDNVFANEYPYDKVLDDCVDRFNDYSVNHNKETVRNMCVHILKDMYPVNLMPSGLCKFVPKKNKSLLYSLQGVIRDLSSYGEACLFEAVPVIDTDEMRDTVQRSAANEITGEAKEFVSELYEILKNKPVLSSRAVTSYVEKCTDLKNKIQEYEGLLGSYLDVARMQVNELFKLVQENKE